MKKSTTIKRFGYGFSALVMTLSTVGFAPVQGAYAEGGCESTVSSSQVTFGGQVNLYTNVTLEDTIGINEDTVINFNACTITGASEKAMFAVAAGKSLTITGTGNVTAAEGQAVVASVGAGASVTFEGGIYSGETLVADIAEADEEAGTAAGSVTIKDGDYTATTVSGATVEGGVFAADPSAMVEGKSVYANEGRYAVGEATTITPASNAAFYLQAGETATLDFSYTPETVGYGETQVANVITADVEKNGTVIEDVTATVDGTTVTISVSGEAEGQSSPYKLVFTDGAGKKTEANAVRVYAANDAEAQNVVSTSAVTFDASNYVSSVMGLSATIASVESENTAVATVNSDKTLTIVASGEAKINVKFGNGGEVSFMVYAYDMPTAAGTMYVQAGKTANAVTDSYWPVTMSENSLVSAGTQSGQYTPLTGLGEGADNVTFSIEVGGKTISRTIGVRVYEINNMYAKVNDTMKLEEMLKVPTSVVTMSEDGPTLSNSDVVDIVTTTDGGLLVAKAAGTSKVTFAATSPARTFDAYAYVYSGLTVEAAGTTVKADADFDEPTDESKLTVTATEGNTDASITATVTKAGEESALEAGTDYTKSQDGETFTFVFKEAGDYTITFADKLGGETVDTKSVDVTVYAGLGEDTTMVVPVGSAQEIVVLETNGEVTFEVAGAVDAAWNEGKTALNITPTAASDSGDVTVTLTDKVGEETVATQVITVKAYEQTTEERSFNRDAADASIATTGATAGVSGVKVTNANGEEVENFGTLSDDNVYTLNVAEKDEDGEYVFAAGAYKVAFYTPFGGVEGGVDYKVVDVTLTDPVMENAESLEVVVMDAGESASYALTVSGITAPEFEVAVRPANEGEGAEDEGAEDTEDVEDEDTETEEAEEAEDAEGAEDSEDEAEAEVTARVEGSLEEGYRVVIDAPEGTQGNYMVTVTETTNDITADQKLAVLPTPVLANENMDTLVAPKGESASYGLIIEHLNAPEFEIVVLDGEGKEIDADATVELGDKEVTVNFGTAGNYNVVVKANFTDDSGAERTLETSSKPVSVYVVEIAEDAEEGYEGLLGNDENASYTHAAPITVENADLTAELAEGNADGIEIAEDGGTVTVTEPGKYTVKYTATASNEAEVASVTTSFDVYSPDNGSVSVERGAEATVKLENSMPWTFDRVTVAVNDGEQDTEVALTVAADGKSASLDTTDFAAGVYTVKAYNAAGEVMGVYTVSLYSISADDTTNDGEKAAAETLKELFDDINNGISLEVLDKLETVLGEDYAEKLEDIQDKMSEGASITTDVQVSVATPDDSTKTAMSEKLAGLDVNGISYYDVSVRVMADGEELTTLSELNRAIKVAIADATDPETGYTRKYIVLHEHNGEVTVLTENVDFVIENGKIYVTTDKFSTFAVAYVDTKNEESDSEAEYNYTPAEQGQGSGVPDTGRVTAEAGSNSNAAVGVTLGAVVILMALAAATKFAKRR